MKYMSNYYNNFKNAILSPAKLLQLLISRHAISKTIFHLKRGVVDVASQIESLKLRSIKSKHTHSVHSYS